MTPSRTKVHSAGVCNQVICALDFELASYTDAVFHSASHTLSSGRVHRNIQKALYLLLQALSDAVGSESPFLVASHTISYLQISAVETQNKYLVMHRLSEHLVPIFSMIMLSLQQIYLSIVFNANRANR